VVGGGSGGGWGGGGGGQSGTGSKHAKTNLKALGGIRPLFACRACSCIERKPKKKTALLLALQAEVLLEVLLCGRPDIDVADGRANTEYAGAFEAKGGGHKVIKWFWETIEEDYSVEQRARLLQFTTGTSGVPASGFSMLQGNDGSIRKFAINSLTKAQSIFPKSHTCFNRIDLPLYDSKKELKKYLTLAIDCAGTGFDMD